MKKTLIIILGILVGIALYIWQDPKLSNEVKNQTQNLINPEATRVYKWQDKKGQWQVSNQPPPGNIPYETLDYDRDTNVMPSGQSDKPKR